MELVTLLVSGAIAAAMAPGALRGLAEAGWARPNYRAAALPFPAGVVAVCAGIAALGVLALAERVLDEAILLAAPPAGPALREGWTAYAPLAEGVVTEGQAAAAAGVRLFMDPVTWLPLWLGVAFLGLLDDVLDAHPRGWRGHARAVLGGGFDTGALKAIGTAALAFFVLSRGSQPLGEVVLSAVVVALATNLFNLLDLRPGRAAKAWLLLAAGLLIGEWDAGPLRLVGVLAGPLLVLGFLDLRERCMLGDTGSNLLGALAGTWLVVSLGPAGEAVAAAVLLGLTLFGEFRSISAAIEKLPPLRALDSLGRRSHA